MSDERETAKPGALLLILTGIALIANLVFSYANGIRETSGPSELLGSVAAKVVLMPAIVVAISRLWRGMRNLRSSTKVFFGVSLLFAIVNLSAFSKTIPYESSTAGSSVKHPEQLRNSFLVDIPNREDLRIEKDGPLPGVPDSYQLIAINEELAVQFTVLIMPSLENGSTFAEGLPEWEQGLLKKASRKVSSRKLRLDGKEAYEVVLEIDADELTFQMRTITLQSNGKEFTLATTAIKGSEIEADLQRFFDSFRIK
ncbi:DUF998 domain-containing protein [Adhaeretor mobilis]|uniref:Uncharacterized protein n=1 Tax=Adhaeretor mobilis TaxID=1930276 RepID=A0A517MSN8_9BACT|nr:DUF998 domain-containing protein [Adhaeretor mobilis]QDS97901.1 hypothetical protein HG15A2_11690 [Adhaeretor mobilis]